MAEWRRLHPEDVAGEEAFWAAKKVARRKRRREGRERRERKKFLEFELDNPSLSVDIDKNSAERDALWCTSEESFTSGSNNNEE
jgi:hypothetical protein